MSDEPIILPPGAGGAYDIGPMRGVPKADGDETGDRYCVSEWSVDPGQPGPGPHHHDSNEELFLVTAGTMSCLVADTWIDAPAGTFVRIPAGVTHDFENGGSEAATAFNVFIPGGFEEPWADRRDTAFPCSVAVDRRGIPASSPAIGVDWRDRAAVRTWPLLGLADASEDPRIPLCRRSSGRNRPGWPDSYYRGSPPMACSGEDATIQAASCLVARRSL